VEEARQHSTVESESFTIDEIGLAIVGGLGALGAVAGVVAYFMIGGRSILLGLLAFTLSRTVMRVWQLARAHAFPRNRASSTITVAFAIMWVFLSLLLAVPLWAMS
jgi:hypothetical protein